MDEEGRISVEDLSGLVSELIAREFKEWDADADDADEADDFNEEDKAKAEAAIEAMRCEVTAGGGGGAVELDDGVGGGPKGKKIAAAGTEAGDKGGK